MNGPKAMLPLANWVHGRPFGIEMLEDRMCQPPNGPPELMKIGISQPTGSMAIPVYPYLNMFEK